MKKPLLMLIISLIASLYSSAQATFQKTFGGTNFDMGWFMQQTTDGGYIIIGSTSSFGAGNSDVYLIRTNVNGDSLWTKTFGGTGIEYGYSVYQTTDGGFILCGTTDSFGSGSDDVYLIRTDSTGNPIWTKTFGGSASDKGRSVQQTADGGYIIAGVTASFGAGSSDIYLIKTEANGDSLWTKTFGGTVYDDGNAILQTTDGGYIITGITSSFGAGGIDAFLIKTDDSGNLLWIKTFGTSSDEAGYAVKQTADGGYIIAGNTNFGLNSTDIYLIKTDDMGSSIWAKTFYGVNIENGYSVQQTMDGGYVISGSTWSFGAGNTDVYLIKTDINGNLLWTKTFGGTDYDGGYSILQTMDGGYIIVGNVKSFGAGNYDVYLIKTDSTGNSGCNEGTTATFVTSPIPQVTNPLPSISSGSNITAPATLIGSGGIITTLCTTVGINEITTGNLFFVSPNLSTGNFIISFEGMIMKGNIEILNILGENVYTENIFNESKKEINLKNISGGIYFVKVFNGEKNYCKKIIIEQD